MSDYPEHDKLLALNSVNQAQGEILNWLQDEGVHFMQWDAQHEIWVKYHKTISEILAEYHGIDRDKLELEKRAILDEIRKGQGEGNGND